MKVAHRSPGLNWFAVPESDATDNAYEAEVQRSTDAGEREHKRLQHRLERAESRLAAARAERAPKRHHLAELQAVVELRREELDEYRRLMVAVPASAEHRGTASFRPVPVTKGSL